MHSHRFGGLRGTSRSPEAWKLFRRVVCRPCIHRKTDCFHCQRPIHSVSSLIGSYLHAVGLGILEARCSHTWDRSPWKCPSNSHVYCCAQQSISMHMFESLQLAGFGKQNKESAPQNCSAGLFVNPPFIERPTPLIGQDESLGQLPHFDLLFASAG